MPCNSDYLEPTHRERELRRTAGLLEWLLERLGKPVEPWIHLEAISAYASDNRVVELLCSQIKKLTTGQMNRYVWNGHNSTSRDLADWWEEHLSADVEREIREEDAVAKATLVASAMSKLTQAEREALLGHD